MTRGGQCAGRFGGALSDRPRSRFNSASPLPDRARSSWPFRFPFGAMCTPKGPIVTGVELAVQPYLSLDGLGPGD